jgi:hypothetical protein
MLILSPLRLRGRRSTATSRPLISTSWLMYSLYCPSGSVELISSLKQGVLGGRRLDSLAARVAEGGELTR